MKKLTVVIPVYKGGEWFRECLESFLPHLACFDTIAASINKSETQEQDIATFREFQKKLPPDITSFYLRQRFSLNARGHAFFINWQLRKKKLAGFRMCMCHDDILLPSFSRNYAQIQPFLAPTTIINPARSFYFNEFLPHKWCHDYYGFRDFPQGLTIDDVALQTLDGIYITNVSGFIFHSSILKQFRRITRCLLYGYRAEYIVLTAPGATTVCSTPEPVIGIRVHAGSQGKIDKPLARMWDEHVYLIHLYRRTGDPLLREKICFQSRLLRVWKHPRRSLGKLLKKIGRKLFR